MDARYLLTATFFSAVLGTILFAQQDAPEPKAVIIDGSKAILAPNRLYRGAGMISANNSSRLLLDYKYEQPAAYQAILRHLFTDEGVGITHLKLEMGSDVNSSSGTEPAVKRTAREKADVTRGAGYQLAADARKVNPALTLDMIFWSEPLWVYEADDVHEARYQWYKETLDAAWQTWQLKFDYVGGVQNERAADPEWIKFLSARLKAEKNCPYDYSRIKIVAGDEVSTWNIADLMMDDPELMAAVDVVGSHYTSWSSPKARELARSRGKELWFSEGSSPMTYSKGTWRFDGTGSGLSGINGVLDIANRIITMVPGGFMTLYEYQPAVAAYYDGVCYAHKQLIDACDPWSGYYSLDSGFFMSLHFSRFIKKGWSFVEDACEGDGRAGGDGHALVDATWSYLTATDPLTGDYSTVITNTTDSALRYDFTVTNLKKAGSPVHVWETRGPDKGAWDENYFRPLSSITPKKKGGAWVFSFTIKPGSLVTLSTLDTKPVSYPRPREADRKILALPYRDDYEYPGYPTGYLAARGGAPRYTTDQGGAFEVQKEGGNHILTQMITPETKAREWGWTPDPVTSFGDDRWFNYRASASARFAASTAPDNNYVGLGLRYNLGSAGQSGYWIKLSENGSWSLMKNNSNLTSGKLADLDARTWTRLSIEARDMTVTASINGKTVCTWVRKNETLPGAGRAAFYSSWNQNSFDNLEITPLEGSATSITRIDDTDPNCTYEGPWEHATMSSYKNYKRTQSTGAENAVVRIRFEGTSLALLGSGKTGTISVVIDGKTVSPASRFPMSGSREIIWCIFGLDKAAHEAVITVKKGSFVLDSVEVSP